MRNKFRLPLVAVFTPSFQNYGSLHLVKAAASRKHAHIQTVDLSAAFCCHGSWSFTLNLCPVQKIKTKFLVCPYFSVRSYCLIRPPFLFTFRVALAVCSAIQPDEAFFSPSKLNVVLLIQCSFYARTSYELVAQLWFTDLVLKWRILMDTVGEKIHPESHAKLIWNDSVFASWGRMASATVSATLKGKQKRRQSNSNNFRH